MKPVWSLEKISLLILLLGLSLQLFFIFAKTDGHFIYTLDDSYIHLSLAENIARGVYGVNLEEYSSPSSSILYPFLLVPFVILGIGAIGPFIIALTAQILSVYVISLFFSKSLNLQWTGSLKHKLFLVLIAFCLPLALNSWGLPFTGMEHSLHLLFSSVLLIGFFKTVSDNAPPWYFLPSLLLTPLVRFEGFALAVTCLLGLVVIKKYRLALVAISSLAVLVSAYVIFMQSLGLPLLPSSVMVKSGIFSEAMDGNVLGSLLNILENFYHSILNGWGIIFSLLILLTIVYVFKRNTSMNVKLTCAAGSGALALHIFFGSYGWFGRYEVYAVGIALIVFSLSANYVLPKNISAYARIALLSAALVLLSIPYSAIAVLTPAGSANIYQQHFQMHRFATEYFPHEVAVNDLGWVSYKNDNFVVDLWGLGSETARKFYKSHGGFNAEAISNITSHYGAKFAMLYPSWFKDAIPANWVPVANLTTSRVTSNADTVTFYLIDPALQPEMQEALRRFQQTLPAGASLEILETNLSRGE